MITVFESNEKRKELENTIAELLDQFSKDTGLVITDISATNYGSVTEDVYMVKVSVELK